MSSTGDPPAEDLWPNDAASNVARHLIARVRASWEVQEIVAAAFLLVVAVFAVTGVASGILGDTAQGNGFAGQAVAQVLLESTQWAGVFTPFLVLCALGLAWWQVDGWADVMQDLEVESGAGDELADADDAVRHITRNRALATWAGVSLLIASMANVGTMVGLGLENDPFPAQQWTSYGGQVVGALILSFVGIVAALHIRHRCDTALARAQDTAASAS
jgi:hypothetical protein